MGGEGEEAGGHVLRQPHRDSSDEGKPKPRGGGHGGVAMPTSPPALWADESVIPVGRKVVKQLVYISVEVNESDITWWIGRTGCSVGILKDQPGVGRELDYFSKRGAQFCSVARNWPSRGIVIAARNRPSFTSPLHRAN